MQRCTGIQVKKKNPKWQQQLAVTLLVQLEALLSGTNNLKHFWPKNLHQH